MGHVTFWEGSEKYEWGWGEMEQKCHTDTLEQWIEWERTKTNEKERRMSEKLYGKFVFFFCKIESEENVPKEKND